MEIPSNSVLGSVLAVVLVVAGFLWMAGGAARGKAAAIVGIVIAVALLAPFARTAFADTAPWIWLLILVVGLVWLIGIIAGLVGGEHARGIVVSDALLTILAFPFRMLGKILGYAAKKIRGRT